MPHIITIAILILGSSFSGCNRGRIAMSDQSDPPTDTNKSIDAVGSPEKEVVASSDSNVPKQWPKCWLSNRLAVITAFRTAGSLGGTSVPPTYTKSDGRQEFKGTSYNPTTSGDCTLNWFDQDHSQEPWVALFKQKFTNYQAVITCRADPTPDCLCAATWPEIISGFSTSTERCIRKTAANSYELYDVREPDPSKTVEAKELCDAALRSVKSIHRANIKQPDFIRQTQDRSEVSVPDQTCRTDFEPFSPLPEEKDWYASEIRDWAISSCIDRNTNCRCYAIHQKSGYQDGERAHLTEHDTCLLCEDSTCQIVNFN